jgi:hypothetical protein
VHNKAAEQPIRPEKSALRRNTIQASTLAFHRQLVTLDRPSMSWESSMSFRSVIIVCLAIAVSGPQLVLGDLPPGDSFRIAFRSQSAERDRLDTWRGRISCTERSPPGELPANLRQQLAKGARIVWREITFTADFLCDVRNDRLRTSVVPPQPVRFLDAAGGLLAETPGGGYETRMLIDADRAWTIRPGHGNPKRPADPRTVGWRPERSRMLEADSERAWMRPDGLRRRDRSASVVCPARV